MQSWTVTLAWSPVDAYGGAGLQPAPSPHPEPMTPIRRFFVADLNAKGELRAEAEYRYEQLEQVPGAADLISTFSAAVWRSPEEFETALHPRNRRLTLRWRASAATAGIATV